MREKFWNSKLVKAQPGDTVVCQGVRATISEIYDQYNDPEDDDLEFYGIEFKDTEGHYRSWKQRFDGGRLFLVDDKPTVVNKLEELLKTTRMFADLDYCKYEVDEHGNEYVHVVGRPNESGCSWHYKVNVTWDSGIALINDVLNHIS